ncbi:MAG: hypothetical protein ACP5OJ_09100 [Methanothermobacter sp.]
MTFGWTELLALLISGGVFLLIVNYFAKYWDVLKEKFRSRGVKLDYQLELVSALIVMVLLFIFIFPIIGGMMHNLPAIFGLLVTVCYPILIMILRHDTFEKVLKIVPEFKVYRIFVVFSCIAGGYYTVAGFSMLNFNYPLLLAFIIVFIGLLGQTVPLLPDYIEKVTKFDLGMNRKWRMNNKKSRNALTFMGVLSIMTFIILRLISLNIQSRIFGI